jgi:hypothetical protein
MHQLLSESTPHVQPVDEITVKQKGGSKTWGRFRGGECVHACVRVCVFRVCAHARKQHWDRPLTDADSASLLPVSERGLSAPGYGDKEFLGGLNIARG